MLFPPPEDLPGPGIKFVSSSSPALRVDFFFFFTTEPPGKPPMLTVPAIFVKAKTEGKDSFLCVPKRKKRRRRYLGSFQ